jgi:hypothetical protein
MLVPGFTVAIRGTFLRGWTDLCAPLIRPVVMTPFAFAASWAVVSLTTGWPAILQVILGGAAGVAAMAVFLVIPVYRRDTKAILDFVLKARRPASRRSASDPDLPENTPAAVLGVAEIGPDEISSTLRAEQSAAKGGRS